MRWKPDGTRLFTGSDGTARIWQVFHDLGEPREDGAESRAVPDGAVAGDSEPPEGGPPMDPASWAARLADLDLAAVERSVIEEAIRRSGGNKSEAARRLGISRTAIGRKVERFKIES